MFNLNDYDCVGFDLDNTVCEYKEQELVQLVYDILAQYLVDVKQYNSEIVQPLDIDFLRKGLTLDIEQGNILDLAFDGTILKATHGTKSLTDSEIESIYGKKKEWRLAAHHCQNFLATWNGELSEKIRSCMDYFDMAVPLLFARAVDSVDKRSKPQQKYMVWPDMLAGLNYMFNKEHFLSDKGEYYPALKHNPQKYIKKCSTELIEWLKNIKNSGKITFLITGSNIPYGSFIAETALGKDWKQYFDVIIFYARKPGFFVQQRPFYSADDENELLQESDLKCPGSYSEGNWTNLMKVFVKSTGKDSPKCLYIGDNLVQDIYAPTLFKDCDTVAIVKELTAECGHEDKLFVSEKWGSFFYSKDEQKYTVWGQIIRDYSKICVPHLEWFVDKPIDKPFPEFEPNRSEKHDLRGYQEFIPICFS